MTERETAAWLAGLIDGEGWSGLVDRTPLVQCYHELKRLNRKGPPLEGVMSEP